MRDWQRRLPSFARTPRVDFKLVYTGNRIHSGWPKVSEAIRLGMPSTFEASSYSVIEAQLLECPAMCSDVTSLPELTRDGAGPLFDPFDAEDIAAKMLFWLENPENAAAAPRAGHARLAPSTASAECQCEKNG
jgi:glycosyltransferase involved in cell wall biosynthesis